MTFDNAWSTTDSRSIAPSLLSASWSGACAPVAPRPCCTRRASAQSPYLRTGSAVVAEPATSGLGMRMLLLLLAVAAVPRSSVGQNKFSGAGVGTGTEGPAQDFWREDLYDPSDAWGQQYPRPKHIRLPAGPLVRALPQFVARGAFRLEYFEKAAVVLEVAKEEQTATNLILSVEDIYSGGPYFFARGGGPPEPEHPLFPKNVNFARGTFADVDTADRPPIEGPDIKAALDRGETIFFNDISSWEPDVARVAYGVAEALGLRTAVNAYMTPPGVSTSIATHNDMQCTFIIQTSGVKHWKVWLKSATLLPVDRQLTVGKHTQTQVDVEQLGPPDIETDLMPGQVLYVPRGALHHTSTSLVETTDVSLTGVPSLHLTLGVNVVRTDPKVDGSEKAARLAKQFNHSVENTASRLILARSPVATASLNSFYAEYMKVAEALTQSDPRFRRSIMYSNARATKESIRDLLSGVIDGLMESPDFLPSVAADVSQEHEHWRAERRSKLDAMLGEPFVPDILIREEPEQTCSVDERDSWSSMKLSALVEVAGERGVGEAAIDAAMESGSPKEALLRELRAAAC